MAKVCKGFFKNSLIENIYCTSSLLNLNSEFYDETVIEDLSIEKVEPKKLLISRPEVEGVVHTVLLVALDVMNKKILILNTYVEKCLSKVPTEDPLRRSDTRNKVINSSEVGTSCASGEIFEGNCYQATAGGDHGMHFAKEPEEFAAKSETVDAFDNDGVDLENYIHNPGHIGFQVPTDKSGNLIHSGECDCSIQVFYQSLCLGTFKNGKAYPRCSGHF
ncbi:hypothetical protein POM88_026932 [Heracleum sosnowskyi]|uniref:Carbamoyl phosphate synthase ATP-binding domain-containing protein n=1 Tax=Heracleum sosnowskyi TaxID=360622 RepID=A0AAD8I967_9APIA|nr:hypothetical protein POM88_026932 [Heracleum sosnowskyi]